MRALVHMNYSANGSHNLILEHNYFIIFHGPFRVICLPLRKAASLSHSPGLMFIHSGQINNVLNEERCPACWNSWFYSPCLTNESHIKVSHFSLLTRPPAEDVEIIFLRAELLFVSPHFLTVHERGTSPGSPAASISKPCLLRASQ